MTLALSEHFLMNVSILPVGRANGKLLVFAETLRIL